MKSLALVGVLALSLVIPSYLFGVELAEWQVPGPDLSNGSDIQQAEWVLPEPRLMPYQETASWQWPEPELVERA